LTSGILSINPSKANPIPAFTLAPIRGSIGCSDEACRGVAQIRINSHPHRDGDGSSCLALM
jgi:hypothetical protein